MMDIRTIYKMSNSNRCIQTTADICFSLCMAKANAQVMKGFKKNLDLPPLHYLHLGQYDYIS